MRIIMTNNKENKKKFISYGFRIKEQLGISNRDIRKIIMDGSKVFRLLAEELNYKDQLLDALFEQFPELNEYKKIHESRKSEIQIVLENDMELDDTIETWVKWGEQRGLVKE